MGRGCPTCHHTGTRGRLGVYELLRLDEEFRHILAQGAQCSKRDLWEYAVKHGFKTMEDVLVAVESIESDYSGNCRAAQEVAAEYFAAEKVVGLAK